MPYPCCLLVFCTSGIVFICLLSIQLLFNLICNHQRKLKSYNQPILERGNYSMNMIMNPRVVTMASVNLAEGSMKPS